MKRADLAKPGRKPIPINQKIVEGMAKVGATNAEIGEFVGCDGDTIGRRFAEVLTKARGGMRTRLRQAQLKLALGGNATMLIWLGKQMLGQRDQLEVGDPLFDTRPLLPKSIEIHLVRPDGQSELISAPRPAVSD